MFHTIPVFSVGSKVKVIREASEKEARHGALGRVGIVQRVITDACGATPSDPLYVVALRRADGFFPPEEETAFWREELDFLGRGWRLTYGEQCSRPVDIVRCCDDTYALRVNGRLCSGEWHWVKSRKAWRVSVPQSGKVARYYVPTLHAAARMVAQYR